MTERIWSSALCWGCAHYNASKPGTCKAFPEGIPYVVMSNEVDHFTKLDEQLNDLVYMSREETK